ncbi:NAD(P)-dependent oxidoreductase [Nocardiopsis tropica]|uniref:NAD(P)-dependent oxidoreductase n=1 Tax=Nocardiopsis tropica TaxID=109330 RepID=A0ABU7KMY4_9ACTN|nr:NAD(P)-dependent oxidoreductase [Nocardiopsis umidischolae]MEE2050653.1 NAD(P)-dependent oxidoreductase [Nocardiopsis umidischolae]
MDSCAPPPPPAFDSPDLHSGVGTYPSAGHDFFEQLTALLPPTPDVATAVVGHLLPTQLVFIEALAQVLDVVSLLPKPRSVDEAVRSRASSIAPCDLLDRVLFRDPAFVVQYLEERAAGRPLVLLDVGGYFAPVLEQVTERFSGTLLGVVEDTENGHRRYLEYEKLPCPVFSAARSPLKDAEDALVGEAVVFSVEALVRARCDVLPGRCACVIGYGKIGSAAADALRARRVTVTVVETDPVRRARATTHGYRTFTTMHEALADSTVVVCATGRRALTTPDLVHLRNGAYVASVTSHDDEMDLSGAHALFHRTPEGPHTTRFSRGDKHFFLLSNGDAVNFVHGSAVGTSIHLVQAELLTAASLLATGTHGPGLHQVPADLQRRIADLWLSTFHDTRKDAQHAYP